MEEFKIRRYSAVHGITSPAESGARREKGISSLTVNGTAVEGNLITLTEGCTEYDVICRNVIFQISNLDNTEPGPGKHNCFSGLVLLFLFLLQLPVSL